ncbi:hypothetical protein Hesp01_73730 [Herbidospora sp. NBRC 101105]|nr:hypothetical protein Hesp01_73730 [Herbidospora sp. NBRC 101105]
MEDRRVEQAEHPADALRMSRRAMSLSSIKVRRFGLIAARNVWTLLGFSARWFQADRALQPDRGASTRPADLS